MQRNQAWRVIALMRPRWRTDLAFYLEQVLLFVPVATAQLVIVVVLGDLLARWGHRAQHAWGPLWRFHAVHHTARHVDWLAAFREHPLDGLYTRALVNLPAIALGLDLHPWPGLVWWPLAGERRQRWPGSRALLMALALLGALAAEGHAAAPERFERGAWQADYAYLKSALEQSYGHLAWFGSPEGGVDLPALDRLTTRALGRARSDEEAREAILNFVASFHDAHLRETEASEPDTPAVAEPPRPTDYADAGTACAAYGYVPASDVQLSLPFETLEGFTLIADGLTEAFRTGVLQTGGARLGIVRISRFRAKDSAPLCVATWTARRARGATTTAEGISEDIDALWLQTLADRLRRLEAEGVTAVVVDVGGDRGGNDLGDWAVRAFTAEPVRSAPLLLRPGPVAMPYLDEQIGGLRGVLSASADLPAPTQEALNQAISAFEARKARASEAPCDMSWVWRERRAWGSSACTGLIEAGSFSGQHDYADPGAFDPRAAPALYWASVADPVRGAWRGPVYVLTDGDTASAAEMFTALIHDRGVARTVGTHTLGAGCGFMDVDDPLVLPHSKLAFDVPNCVRLRGDGTDEVAGLSPDLPAAPLPGESDRARAARVVALIVGDLRR